MDRCWNQLLNVLFVVRDLSWNWGSITLIPGRLCEEQTNSSFRGSRIFVMSTVPLHGCWETQSSSDPESSPDSELLSSLSLLISASKAARFSPTGDVHFTPFSYWNTKEAFVTTKIWLMDLQETSSSLSASASSREPRPWSWSVQQLRAWSVWLITVCSFAASSFRAWKKRHKPAS